MDAASHYSLLLGHDWIHTNECVPSTLHEKLFQWVVDRVEEVVAKGRQQLADVSMESIGQRELGG